jgi:hypothetical protein
MPKWHRCMASRKAWAGSVSRVATCESDGSRCRRNAGCGLNYRGLDVLSIRNVIVRNIAIANSNADYNIVAGNSQGPIINVAGVGDISGTAGANTPMANYQY